jgi:hypothetical protein
MLRIKLQPRLFSQSWLMRGAWLQELVARTRVRLMTWSGRSKKLGGGVEKWDSLLKYLGQRGNVDDERSLCMRHLILGRNRQLYFYTVMPDQVARCGRLTDWRTNRLTDGPPMLRSPGFARGF